MIRITASHGRKHATEGRTFQASIEVELADGDAAMVVERIHGIWNELQRAVDERMAGNGADHRPAPSPTAQAQTVRPPAVQVNANGHAPAVADNGQISGKQKNYLLGLSSKRGWRVGELNENIRQLVNREDATLHSLTRQEASRAIESLKEDP